MKMDKSEAHKTFIEYYMDTLSPLEHVEESERTKHIPCVSIKPKRSPEMQHFMDEVKAKVYKGNTSKDLMVKICNLPEGSTPSECIACFDNIEEATAKHKELIEEARALITEKYKEHNTYLMSLLSV